jgi:hypothetical protein
MGKAKKKISNWSSYNHALVNRGSMMFWIDDKLVRQSHCVTHNGGRDRGFLFSDTAIETALMIKAVYSQPLRATEGFLNSVFDLMQLPCRSPSYSCLSKRVSGCHKRSLSETAIYRYKTLFGTNLLCAATMPKLQKYW